MRFFNGPSYKGKDGRVRWALMSSFDIPCTTPELIDRAGNITPASTHLYLRRLRVIQTPWFGVYLHEMYGPDGDRDLHDHPWNFYTFILKGGYMERFKKDVTDSDYKSWIFAWPRWSGHRVGKTNGHQIVSLMETPTTTLVFTGRRTRDWGFWTDLGWVPWDEYHEVTGRERAV